MTLQERAAAAREHLNDAAAAVSRLSEQRQAAEAECERLSAEIAEADPDAEGFGELVAKRAMARARGEAFEAQRARAEGVYLSAVNAWRPLELARRVEELEVLAARAREIDAKIARQVRASLESLQPAFVEQREVLAQAEETLRQLAEERHDRFDPMEARRFALANARWAGNEHQAALAALEALAAK